MLAALLRPVARVPITRLYRYNLGAVAVSTLLPARGGELFRVWLLTTREDLPRSEEHTSELQSPCNLVCRLLLEKKKIRRTHAVSSTQGQRGDQTTSIVGLCTEHSSLTTYSCCRYLL